MNVHLTFDIEVWCDGWDSLDATFPASFERYVYAKSAHGSYALPKTLEILERHGLTGVFFVEPLFAARFGLEYLRTVVDLIRVAGHSVQLHLHPEWVDEIRPALIANSATTVPEIAPRPPKISVPPRTTAVIANSSKPSPMLEIVEPRRDVIITAQIPATVPLNANASRRTRSTPIPEKLLVDGLLPDMMFFIP